MGILNCMKYNPDIHHRRSIRLKGYDYSQRGAYFVTVCAQNRECLFGKINGGKMVMNEAGGIHQNLNKSYHFQFGNGNLLQISPNPSVGPVAQLDRASAFKIGASTRNMNVSSECGYMQGTPGFLPWAICRQPKSWDSLETNCE